MSLSLDDDIKRWTAKHKTALVMDIVQGKTKVAEDRRAFDFTPSEIESWVEDARKGMENALRANPLDIREQYERQLKDLQETEPRRVCRRPFSLSEGTYDRQEAETSLLARGA